MGDIEPLHGLSEDEKTTAAGWITPAGDFRSASKRGRGDSGEGNRNAQRASPTPDDEVVLSDVAQVNLREEEGMSVDAIAADLGLTTETVRTDIAIAAAISHPQTSSQRFGASGAISTV